MDADFYDLKILAREEKNRIALFLIGELREFPLDLFYIQQEIGSKCHLVRKPVVVHIDNLQFHLLFKTKSMLS
jgi:hypothetical protein